MPALQIHTSTPLNPSIPKHILADSTNSPKRGGQRLLSKTNDQTPNGQLEIDDELDRSVHREHASIQKRLSSISSLNSTPKYRSDKEIRDHFQICLKMHAENKISSKNAWNLKIIDFMNMILESQGLTVESLQMASTTLDAGAKVYGLRVDDIHSDVLKLAGNMARAAAAQQALNDEAENGEEEGDGEGDKENKSPGKKKRKRKMFGGQKSTVAKDPKSLVVNELPKVESVFFQTRTNINLSCIENLCTYKFPMNYSGYKFMLLSKEKAFCPVAERVPDPNLNFEKKVSCSLPTMKNLQICAPFADFAIDEWDPEQENQMLISRNNEVNQEVVFDLEGVPIPELDGSVHDLFANNDANDLDAFSDEEENGEPHKQLAINTNHVSRIVDFMPRLAEIEHNDYSFVSTAPVAGNRLLTQIWAGPSHWKLKHLRPAVGRCAGQSAAITGQPQQCKSAKKVRIQPALIDFYAEESNILNMKTLQRRRRARIEQNTVKVTLPERLIFAQERHRCLLMKTELMLKEVVPTYARIIDDKNDEDEVGDYNYENPNDSQYCPQRGVDDNDDFHGGDGDHHLNNDEDDFHEDRGAALAQQNFLGDNLIDMPETVRNTYVPYAMQAKKMDMKRLKVAVWDTLTNTNKNSGKEIIKDRPVHTMRFSEVYQQLPTRISEKMTQELSAPLAFAALLHLCNEQNLELIRQSDLKDLTIRQSVGDLPVEHD